MTKTITAVIVLALAYLGYRLMSRAQPTHAQTIQIAAATASQRPTQTPIPPATVDYEATSDSYKSIANVAVMTANEASRVNAQTTAEHEAVLLAQSQLTAQAEAVDLAYVQLTAASNASTATAALTSIPLTATQQSALNTQIPAGNALRAGQLTATHEAPTQYAAMVNAKNSATYGWMSYVAMLIISVVIAVFFVAIIVWVARNPVLPRATVAEPQTEFVINRVDNKNGGYHQKRYDVPGSPEQLTWLSELAANGEKRYSINRIEKMEGPLKSQRPTLVDFRDFLTRNEFAIEDDHGMITLNSEGELFLYDWRKRGALPDDYYFEAEDGEGVEQIERPTPPPLAEMQEL